LAIKAAKMHIIINIVADYIAMVEACKEVLWTKNFLQELGMK
jgi:hypothetical protein